MPYLVGGLLLFVAVHMVAWLPPLRRTLVRRLGPGGYQGAFALAALAGLTLVVVGYRRVPFSALYAPPAWGDTAALLLMLPAAVLLVAAYAPGNVRRYTRHPMLWGVSLWAVAHLSANGDLASVVLFGTFALYALLAMASANLRGARKSTHRVPWSRDAFAVIIGLVVYSGMLRLHVFVFGVSPLH